MRLIDAETFKTYMRGALEQTRRCYPDGGEWAEAITEEFCRDIDAQPTVQPEPKWIPVSERLPEEHDSIWNRFYGTDRFMPGMWRRQSKEVLATELFEDGTTRTAAACTHDGEWYVKVRTVKREIIAWMPLPEPYREWDEG